MPGHNDSERPERRPGDMSITNPRVCATRYEEYSVLVI